MDLSLGIHERQNRGLRGGSMGTMFAHRPDGWSLFPDPHDGMREPTLKSCFLASIYQHLIALSKAHAHTNTHKRGEKLSLSPASFSAF